MAQDSSLPEKDAKKDNSEKSSTSGAGVQINSFESFRQKFLDELSSRYFGESIRSVREYDSSLTAGAKEIERTGAKQFLLKSNFLRRAHSFLEKYVALMEEQPKVQQISAGMGRSIKKLRGDQATLQSMERQIMILFKRLDEDRMLSPHILEHLQIAWNELAVVEDALLRVEKSHASEIHIEDRRRHDKEAAKRDKKAAQRDEKAGERAKKNPDTKYQTSFRPIDLPYDYELASLNKKAPQEWLLKTLDANLCKRFKLAKKKVSDITRYRIMAAVVKSGGLPPILPLSIKESLAEAKRRKKSARK